MFVHNITPDLIKIGPFSIRFYGIVYAIGFAFIAYYLGKKAHKIKNLTKDKAYDLATIGMIGGLIGARLFHVISDFHLYQNNLLSVFAIWKGGLGFQGGLVGALLAGYIYCKKHKINLIRIMDAVSVPLPFFIGLGRIANFINGEHIGFASNLPWCVVFPFYDNICRHPAQIYQAITQFILFVVMFFLSRTKLAKKPGNIAYSFILGYGAIRFITDFFRINYSFYIFGVSHTQLISLIMIISGLYFLYKNMVKK